MATKVLFIDESGDHSLSKIDPQYPMFVLGGIIMPDTYARQVLRPVMQAFKEKHLQDPSIILHTADIVRRRNGFERLHDVQTRTSFLLCLNKMMRDLDYKVVAAAIRKCEYLAEYGDRAMDPYFYCLKVLVERLYFETEVGDTGLIVAEARGAHFDRTLELAWEVLLNEGTFYVGGSALRKRGFRLIIRDKASGDVGLQMADLVVSPIGRYLLGKEPKEDWEIIRSKFRRTPWRSGDEFMGPGLMVFPRGK